MHSSRMHTAHSLPSGGISVRGSLCPGVSLSRGLSVQGSLCPGVSLSRGLCPGGSLCGGSLSGRPLLPVDRQMSVKILPCPQLRLRAVIIKGHFHFDLLDLDVKIKFESLWPQCMKCTWKIQFPGIGTYCKQYYESNPFGLITTNYVSFYTLKHLLLLLLCKYVTTNLWR